MVILEHGPPLKKEKPKWRMKGLQGENGERDLEASSCLVEWRMGLAGGNSCPTSALMLMLIMENVE